ncbi:Reh1 protein [Saccharomycopsis crataegensis]|uniref:Reh1 protein n=1 Tax=Saccharomycopsis crataegensis TaxID=43959 RepID=A0AAV5QK64_9ASCO|nr:Reh1 protein [Saccharomycopsis crataegensis]
MRNLTFILPTRQEDLGASAIPVLFYLLTMSSALANLATNSSTFSCNTCGIRFITSESQKSHMKSEWHRYNLKRRVADLPTISSETFVEKVKQNQIDVNTYTINRSSNEDEYGFVVRERKKNGGKRQITKKDLKKMSRGRQMFTGAAVGHSISGNALGNRSSSPNASEYSYMSLGDSVHSSQATETISIADTLSLGTGSLNSPILHPVESIDDSTLDTEEEVDQDDYGDDDDDEEEDYDILAVNGCLYCNSQNSNFEELLEHMLQKHGLFIPDKNYLVDAEGLVSFLWEILSDYNECLSCGFFGKNLESIQDHCISKAHCRMPYETNEERALFSPFFKYPVSSTNNSEAVQNDECKLDPTGVELALPSGFKVGHRSMMRYYRQDLKLDQPRMQSQTTVMSADRRLQNVNMGGLSKPVYDKEFKKMLTTTHRQRNISERRMYNKNSQINQFGHFRDPNRT